ncbi:MAG: hypothetical protein ACPGVS_08980, partial [Primorskyibacter sp.]
MAWFGRFTAVLVLLMGLGWGVPGHTQGQTQDLSQNTAQTDADEADQGRGYLQAWIEDSLSDAGRQVRITGFAGALSARATLQELTIADDAGVWLTLRGVVFDWNRVALLSGRLEVTELSARHVNLARLPLSRADAPSPGIALPRLPAPQATRLSLPNLPVSVQVGRFALERLSLGADVLGTPIEARAEGQADLEGGGQGRVTLRLERTDNRVGVVALTAGFGPVSEGVYDGADGAGVLTLDLSVTEAADGIVARLLDLPGKPAVDLVVRGDGPVNAYRADIRLATDGVDRLSGQVSIRDVPQVSEVTGRGAQTMQIAADLAGDLRPLVPPSNHAFLGARQALRVRGVRPAEGGVVVDDLSLQTDQLDIRGQLALGPDGQPVRAALDVRVAETTQTGTLTGAPVTVPGTQVRLDHASATARFDAALGPDWLITAEVAKLDTPDGAIGAVTMRGAGQIQTTPAGTDWSGAVQFAATQIALRDAAVHHAVGEAAQGRLRLSQGAGGPLVLSDVDLRAGDVTLRGTASFGPEPARAEDRAEDAVLGLS